MRADHPPKAGTSGLGTLLCVVFLLACGSSATPSESPGEATNPSAQAQEEATPPTGDPEPGATDDGARGMLWADSRTEEEGGGWPAVGLPFGDTRVRVGDTHLEVGRLGMPPSSIGSWDARRLSARRIAEDRARAALIAWVDARLATTPDEGRALVHEAAEAGFVVLRTHSLVDGSAVLVCGVPRAALRDAAALEGMPW